jgi:hypothetical protein
MSHSEALCRLTVGDKGKDMIRWALRRAIDEVERNLTTDGVEREQCRVSEPC